MALSSMVLQLGVFKFLLLTQIKTNTKKMRPQCALSMRCFMHVYIPTPAAVDGGTHEPDGTWLL